MRFRLTILRKGLILICFPLLFQLVVIVDIQVGHGKLSNDRDFPAIVNAPRERRARLEGGRP